MVLIVAGSADAILALVNAGAVVEAEDKDGLTGNKSVLLLSFETNVFVLQGFVNNSGFLMLTDARPQAMNSICLLLFIKQASCLIIMLS